jgi:hypothetical protein
MKPGRVGLKLSGGDAVVTGGVADVGAAVWGRVRDFLLLIEKHKDGL